MFEPLRKLEPDEGPEGCDGNEEEGEDHVTLKVREFYVCIVTEVGNTGGFEVVMRGVRGSGAREVWGMAPDVWGSVKLVWSEGCRGLN